MSLTCDDRTVPEISELDWNFAVSQVRASFAPSRQQDERATPEPVSPQRARLVRAGIKHLSILLRQLLDLRNEAEVDEYGVLRASQHAYEAACQLLIDAAIEAARQGRQIPYGRASTDSEGGVRIEWVRPTAGVHLAVPAAPGRNAYIYHEVGDKYAMETASPKGLAHWLREIS